MTNRYWRGRQQQQKTVHPANKKKNFFELITELIGWISIAVSPLLIGSFIGIMIYSFKTTDTGLMIAIFFACAGLITGIIWATKVWMKTGTIQFLSKLISSAPDKNKADADQTLNDQPGT